MPQTGEYVRELRDFIDVIYSVSATEEVREALVEDTHMPEIHVTDRLADLVFKLRSHSEPLMESASAQDYSLGVEAGCEMAAEMIENLIRQLGEEQK